MFFFYSGNEPVDVVVPGEQYAFRVEPSDRGQKTTNEKLYDFLFSDLNPKRAMFYKAFGFAPDVQGSVPVPEENESHGGDDE